MQKRHKLVKYSHAAKIALCILCELNLSQKGVANSSTAMKGSSQRCKATALVQVGVMIRTDELIDAIIAAAVGTKVVSV